MRPTPAALRAAGIPQLPESGEPISREQEAEFDQRLAEAMAALRELRLAEKRDEKPRFSDCGAPRRARHLRTYKQTSVID